MPIDHDELFPKVMSGEVSLTHFCMSSETEMKVCDDICERQRRGVAKYGTTVAANPLELRQWLQHAYEECLDQAVYLRRAMDEIDTKGGA